MATPVRDTPSPAGPGPPRGLACAVLGFAVVTGSAVVLGLGVALVVVAALTTWTLHLAGRGKPGGPRPVGGEGRRTRDSTAPCR
ncbi:hypothetical protein GA0115239_10341, partial [Streptomyces sp. BpilaLS-43]